MTSDFEYEVKNVIMNEDGEMVISEDQIMVHSSISEDPEYSEEIYDIAQQAATRIKDISKEVNFTQVALAGFILIGIIFLMSGIWIWMIPRDAVSVETVYIQSGGHIVMSEINNAGTRAITDVEYGFLFLDEEGRILNSTSTEVDIIESHSSVAGNTLEMLIQGHSVWENYTIQISLEYVNYKGETISQTWDHPVGYWATEEFVDRAPRTVWPF